MNSHQPPFTDVAIRRFLLGRLGANKRAQFERALFLHPALEQRTRLEEMALADDYVGHRLGAKDLRAFVERFPFSAARKNQIEVSFALRACFTPAAATHRTEASLTFKHPRWKLAFATMILIMLFATIWLATKEPRIVRRLVPNPIRLSAPPPPTPQVMNHAERGSAPATHTHDQQMPPPGHELLTDMVLDSTTTADNAPTVTLATIRDKRVRVELKLSETAQSTYFAELMKNTGESVFSEAEIPGEVNAQRLNFDIPIESLAPADFQIKLTRTADGKQAIYFLRVR